MLVCSAVSSQASLHTESLPSLVVGMPGWESLGSRHELVLCFQGPIYNLSDSVCGCSILFVKVTLASDFGFRIIFPDIFLGIYNRAGCSTCFQSLCV